MKQKRHIYAFNIISCIIAIFVMMFIFLALFSIVIKGSPFLKEAFLSQEVQFSLKLSIYTSSVSTLLCLVLAVPSAYSITRTNLPFKRFFEILIEIPLSLPHIVLGLCLLLIFSSDFGFWMADNGLKVIYTQNGIIIAQLFVNLPFTIRVIKTSFAEVDTKLEFAARTLGASKFETFLKVTLPLCKNTIIGALILTWSRALGEFGAALMVAGATRMKTETLPVNLYLNMATGEIDKAMASAIILLIISVVSLLLFNIFNKNHNQGRFKSFM